MTVMEMEEIFIVLCMGVPFIIELVVACSMITTWMKFIMEIVMVLQANDNFNLKRDILSS